MRKESAKIPLDHKVHPFGPNLEAGFTTVALMIDAREALAAIAEPFAHNASLLGGVLAMSRAEFAGVMFWAVIFFGSVTVILLDGGRLLRGAVHTLKCHTHSTLIDGAEINASAEARRHPNAAREKWSQFAPKHKTRHSAAPSHKGRATKKKRR